MRHARLGRSLMVCAMVAALGVVTLPAGASTLPEEEQAGSAGAGERPRLLDQPINAQVWTVWAAGRRGFALADQAGDGLYKTLVAVDLDTGEQVGREALPFGASGIATMDEAGGRLFVYEATNLEKSARGSLFDGSPARMDPEVRAIQSGSPCVYTNASVRGIPCAIAVWEVDAATLAVGKRMALPSLRAEGLIVNPLALSTDYSPPRDQNDGAKLYVVRRDYPDWAPSAVQAQESPLARANGVQTLVTQIDVATGIDEWTYRVDACRSTRSPFTQDGVIAIMGRPAAAAVFRDPRPEHPFVYLACNSSGGANSGTVVRIPLDERGAPPLLPVVPGDPAGAAGRLGQEGPQFRPAAGDVGGPAASPDVFVGPERTYEFRADPVSGRILMTVVDGSPAAQVIWVFDALSWRILGTIGIGQVNPFMKDSLAGMDPVNGRMYVLISNELSASRAGLYLIDFRRTPLAQALSFPEFGRHAPPKGSVSGMSELPELAVLPGDGGPSRIYVPNAATMSPWTKTKVIEDPIPTGTDAEVAAVRRSLDLDEAESVTAVALDGAARGFGVRALLVGGAEAVARLGPVDPLGAVLQLGDRPETGNDGGVTVAGKSAWSHAGRPDVPCGAVNREMVLGFVGPRGPAVVDAGGSRGGAEPVVVDSATTADGEAPFSRCGTVTQAIHDWDSLWAGALFGRPPVAEPSLPALGTDKGVECVSSDQQSASSGDPVAGTFAAKVNCSEEEASGFAYTRGFAAGVTSVGEALSSFRIYRDPGRGIVSRVEAVSRGIAMDGLLRIDTVRGTAESWANGRTQPVAAAEREPGYDPNCDFERTAGTCFTRNVFGVWTPSYSCGPCGDEAQLVERMNKGFGSYGSVRFRQPDPALAAGSEDGFTAAVQKPDEERFADLVLSNDLLQTVVPSLEIVRYAPPNRPLTNGGPRGRQIYQFAGVEVSSSYAIACLLVYDEETSTCAAAKETPGSITVSLSDNEGAPLAGGAFEVREDVDADGVLGLADTLLPDGACVTADDGVGTCTFEGLQPGSYLVSQVAAPPGYAKSTEPWVSEVASGEQRIVAFTNVSNVSTIDMTVTDDAGAPLSGATFAAYPDPDADGKVAPDAEPAATCTTDAEGVCSMQVPAGSYVLVQTGAPGGLEGIEPVAFTFASGGQVAAVTVVNYPPETPAAPEGAASPTVVDYSPPVGYSPPVESVSGSYVPGDIVDAPTAAGPSVPEQIGGTVVRVIRAPGDALRLLSRDPQQAVAFTAALALLVLALLAVRRRQLLGALTAVPAFAFTGSGGGGTPPAPPPGAPPRPRGPSGGGGPSSGPGGSGPSRRPDPDRPMSPSSATAVRERPPVISGAAPLPAELVSVTVVTATALPGLGALVSRKLASAERCDLREAVDSFDGLRSALERHTPDVVVVDLALLPPAVDLRDLLARLHPLERTVGLVTNPELLEQLADGDPARSFGGLLVTDHDLVNGHLGFTVRQVAVGHRCYGPKAQTMLASRQLGPLAAAREPEPVPYLTRRELEVARLAAQGLRHVIGRRLFISDQTVKIHLRRARHKLGVDNPRDFLALRRRLAHFGLLDDETDRHNSD